MLETGEWFIYGTVIVPAAPTAVWDAWTTEAGARTFFAPECRIDLRVGGAYEMFFEPDAPPGSRGGEGLTILAIQPEQMLSITWNAPPHLTKVRNQMTHVTVRLEPIDTNHTKVTLHHDGWGIGGEWDMAYKYFDRAWNDIVLPRLRQRFESGPIQWEKE